MEHPSAGEGPSGEANASEHNPGSLLGLLKDSTPKKRSKWDVDDADTTEAGKPAPRRKKAKKGSPSHSSPHSSVATLSIRSASSTPRDTSSTSDLAMASAERPTQPRNTRSAFVPPRSSYPSFVSCRSVYCYERLNHIEEGSYGVVFRAREKSTGDIVAIKKLKLDEEKNGFPITSLREVMALMTCKHENVVPIREIVVGETLTQYVRFPVYVMPFHHYDW